MAASFSSSFTMIAASPTPTTGRRRSTAAALGWPAASPKMTISGRRKSSAGPFAAVSTGGDASQLLLVVFGKKAASEVSTGGDASHLLLGVFGKKAEAEN